MYFPLSTQKTPYLMTTKSPPMRLQGSLLLCAVSGFVPQGNGEAPTWYSRHVHPFVLTSSGNEESLPPWPAPPWYAKNPPLLSSFG